MESTLRGAGLSRKFSLKTYYLSPETALKYTVSFLLLLLFSSVEKYGFALSVGLLVGLTYGRQNLLITTPLFIIAGVVFYANLWTLLYLALPPVILASVYLICWRIKKNVPLWTTALCGALSVLPYVIINALSDGILLYLSVAFVIAVIFSLCCSIACYSVLIRGIKCRFTLDEKISAGVFVIAAAYSLCALNVYGFRLFWLFAPMVILLFSEQRSAVETLIVSVLLGLGATLNSAEVGMLGVVVLASSASLAVKTFSRFASAVAATSVLVVAWLLSVGGCVWQGLVLFACGGCTYCVLPLGVRRFFAGSGDNNAIALNALVNRNRTETAARLNAVSEVFADMSDGLHNMQNLKESYSPKRLATEIAKSYCARCTDREGCFSALGGDTAPVLEPLAAAVLARGKATILDTPTFITSRCNKLNNLLAVVNNAGEAYRSRALCAEESLNAKRLMSEQFAGIALVLDALSRECGEHLSFGGENTERIENELLKHNIVARDTLVCSQGDSISVSLTVRACDANKTALVKTVSKCMRTRLSVCDVLPKGEDRIVRLNCAPLYEIAFGIAERKREGEEVSGDSTAVLSPSRTKRIFAIFDGMGSGQAAATASEDAVRTVENFYRAGFDNSLILSLVNKLLCLNDNDVFSALDIAVVDTASGGLDVIKLGAASGFLVRKDSIEIIRSSAPPAGILERVIPVTERYQMYDGDMLILASDGVVDALSERGVTEAVTEINTVNPQSLADGILMGALANGAVDDCTVTVLRLIAV